MNSASEDAGAFSVDLLANARDIDPSTYHALAKGESEIITYSYDVTDNHGDTVATSATITITGIYEPMLVNTGTIIQESENDSDIGIKETKDSDQLTDAIVGITLSLSAGVVSWVLKTGSLMASFMSTMPLWKQFDPLPILGAAMLKKRKHDAQQKIGEDEKDAEVEKLFK